MDDMMEESKAITIAKSLLEGMDVKPGAEITLKVNKVIDSMVELSPLSKEVEDETEMSSEDMMKMSDEEAMEMPVDKLEKKLPKAKRD